MGLNAVFLSTSPIACTGSEWHDLCKRGLACGGSLSQSARGDLISLLWLYPSMTFARLWCALLCLAAASC